jgi:site-specific recombinase XerC
LDYLVAAGAAVFVGHREFPHFEARQARKMPIDTIRTLKDAFRANVRNSYVIHKNGDYTCNRESKLHSFATLGQTMKTVDKRPTDPVSREDVQALLAIIPTRTTTGKRNRAIVRLLWESGVRIAEALALKPGDVDLDRMELRVRKGKGGKYRTAYFSADAKALIAVWIERRNAMGIDDKKTLFCTHAGKRINPAYIRSWMARLSVRMGKRIHAHGFRAGFALNMARQSVPVLDISKAMGHTNTTTTAVYLSKYPDAAVADAVRSCQW